jgi:catechol 2,3-dioxygenase-like lactoylglutathione lyase family enzyme
MRVTISIDVPSIEEGLAFFGDVFGFVETARPHPGYAMLTSGEASIGFLAKPAGSSPAAESADVRRYERHWKPVHVDFRVEDFEATLERARSPSRCIAWRAIRPPSAAIHLDRAFASWE